LEHNLAVLIDFENIAAGTEKEGHGRFDIRAVLRRLKDKGRILVARAYGDWGRYAKFKQQLLEQGVQMMELTSYRGQDKNRADIALVVDAMELAMTRDYIDTFVLLSGDSDFTPLVERLKELNRRVIGIGTRRSTSRLLSERCDEFIFYESIQRGRSDRRGRPDLGRHGDSRSSESRPTEARHTERENGRGRERAAEPEAETLDREEAFALLVETVANLQAESPDPSLAGLVKQSMKRKTPTFDETEYGFSGFARFLEAGRSHGLVVLSRDSKAGGYRVALPDGADGGGADEADAMIVEIPRLPGRAGELEGILASRGIDPLPVLQRHTVVHELVDHVTERQRRKKRNTLMYVFGDISRRCRKTDPVVSPVAVKMVINTIKDAGEFLHSDGDPVRSPSAHFVLRKDAEELMRSLRTLYVRALLLQGENLSDSAAVSMVLWGDVDHAMQAEELVAWILHDIHEDAAAAAATSTVEPEGSEAPAEGATDAPPSQSAPEAAEEAAEPAEAEPPVAEEEAVAPVEVAPVEATPAEAEVEAKPKPKTVRRRKKKVEPVEDAEEAPVEKKAAPKRKPRRASSSTPDASAEP